MSLVKFNLPFTDTAILINFVGWKVQVSPVRKENETDLGKNGATRDLNVSETNVSTHFYTFELKKKSKEATTMAHKGQQRKRRQN